jgi:putative copper export protein
MAIRLEEAALRAAQWGNLGAILVVAGTLVFFALVWSGSRTPAKPVPVEHRYMRGWRRMSIVSWIVALLLSIPLLLRADSLRVEALRLALLLVAGSACLAMWRSGWSTVSLRGSPARLFLTGATVLGLLLSAALTGHARTSSLPLPNFLVALVHVTAAATWVGGLVALVALAFPAVRGLPESDRAPLLAPVISRFSDVAVWSVLVVVASGIYSTWMEVGGLRAFASTYGWVLLAKLSAFLPVLALGGVNNRWTKPKLMRAAREDPSSSAPLLVLRRLVLVEIVLLAVVLALTVVMLKLPPPTSLGDTALPIRHSP